MTIAVFTEREFIHLICLSKEKLYLHVCKLPPREIMSLRRQLQVSLSRYSKGKRTVDGIQLQALGQIQWIENYCRRRYFKDMAAEVRRKYPNFTETAIKERTKDAWEKFVVKSSY